LEKRGKPLGKRTDLVLEPRVKVVLKGEKAGKVKERKFSAVVGRG